MVTKITPGLYLISTLGYALVFVLAILSMIYFIFQSRWFLAIIFLLMMLVCLDNFFCSARMCSAGYRVVGHYAIPPFLRKNKKK
jgi:hypothetical protein